jgi:hypothetical protein
MRPSSRHCVPVLVAVSLGAAVLACGGKTPVSPSQSGTQPVPPPTVTVNSISIGVAGNAPPTLAPGDKLQLFAQAANSDGTVIDVTNLAVWQSSNPVVATVAPTGVLTAAAFGALDISATYQGHTGSLHAEVQQPGCRATVSPESVAFGAIESSGFVTVTATRSDCRWTARSDAAWLPFNYDPGRSGSGGFNYTVPGNNNNDPRDANIVVAVVGGPAAVQKIHQERPVSCVYKVAPEKASFSANGGTGSVQVTTLPADCQWKITEDLSSFGIFFTGVRTGTGAGRVAYSVARNTTTFDFDVSFSVKGLSGVNPPGQHFIHIGH